jgi:hypothetical protein
MKYLCLIHLDQAQLDALPAPEMDALNAAHLDLNDELRASHHFIEAEALEPAATTTKQVRVRQGKALVTDGPFAETKELVAGFYLIEARDQDEAVQIAARLPAARLGVVEVRTTRQLIVPGRS